MQPKALAAAVSRHPGLKLRQSRQDLSLLFGDSVWRPELDTNVEVARSTGIHTRQSAAAQMEDVTTLGASRNLERDVCGDGGDAHLAPEHKLRVRDQHLGVEIFTVALEARVFSDFE